MNFVSSLPGWAWIPLGMVPVGILLLYFLKLRRQPLVVPSTFLWERTIEDVHVNSLIQRLRNNLLLFLQLLFVAIAILALLRPGWLGESGAARRLIFLLDASASMQATSSDDQPSRFDIAKGKIAEQIDALRGGDVAMLIAFSDRADILHEFTSDRRRLLDALSTARVTNRPTNMLEALRAAAGLANPNRSSQASDANDVQVADAMPADLYIYSDGGFQAVVDFNLGNLTPTFVSIGEETVNNVAIIAFSAERNPEFPDQVQAFARVANYGGSTVDTSASLFLDGELVDAQNVEMESGEETGLSFQLNAPEGAELALRLDSKDDLLVDNQAYAGLSAMRNVSVLIIGPGNQSLELAMETEQAKKLGTVEVRSSDYLATDEYKERASLERDDLIIYDRCAPTEMPPVNTFFVGALPPKDWAAGVLTGPVLPIDIDRTHPMMRYLELFSLNIVEGRALQPPRGAVNLITADIGPVLSLSPRDGFQDLVMGFDILSATNDGGRAYNTDWPVQRSWPVFIYNVMRFLGGAVDTSGALNILPGEVAALRVDNRLRRVRVDSPQGVKKSLDVGPSGNIPFADTEATGLYRVMSSEGDDPDPVSVFTVNLFDSRESNILPVQEIELGYEAIASQVVGAPRRSELWRWLLVAALGILCVEWVVFNRRLV